MLDSITRLARAFNKWVGRSGRGGATMTGGLDIKAMDIPKKLFATARAFQEGGSLTVVGTCLVDTNSRMDEAIFQEFKGTGNMELVLDRNLADRRVWPSIDISPKRYSSRRIAARRRNLGSGHDAASNAQQHASLRCDGAVDQTTWHVSRPTTSSSS